MSEKKNARIIFGIFAIFSAPLILSCNSGNSSTETCGKQEYDTSIYRCEMGELVGKCKGDDFYPAYQTCYNGAIIETPTLSSSSSQKANTKSSSSVKTYSSSSIQLAKGTFTDGRDQKDYKYVTIGAQTWMAENLNYNASGSKCNHNETVNCTKYGRLYDWETAMGACPIGWHLPSNEEWYILMKNINSICMETTNKSYVYGCFEASDKLKAQSGWNWYEGDEEDGISARSGNGTDDFGFSALPGGDSNDYEDDSDNEGNNGYWWNTTEFTEYDVDGGAAYYWKMGPSDVVMLIPNYKSHMYSVRCVKE